MPTVFSWIFEIWILITSLTNNTKPLCLLCEKTFRIDAMKPAKVKDHLERLHSDKKHKDIDYFKTLKEENICSTEN